MIKIAYVLKNLKLNGIGNVVLNQCKNINKKKYSITIFTCNDIDDDFYNELRKLDVEIIILPNKTSHLIKYLKELKKDLKDRSFDILCVHGNSRITLFELLIGKKLRIKKNIMYAHSTNTDHMIFHKISKFVFNRVCDKVIACSIDAAKFINMKNYIVIPNGIDTKDYIFSNKKRSKLKRELNLKDSIVIGHIGLFNKSKNHKYLIDIFNDLKEKHKNYKLLLVGYGKYFDDIKKYALNTKFKDDIILYGKGSSSSLLNVIDIFVFPSLYEGFGLSLLEAQINGLPCIVSENIPKDAIINDNIKVEKLINKNLWIEYFNKEHKRINIDINNFNKFDINNSIKELEKEFDISR